MKSQEHFDKARQHIAQAKDLKARKKYGPASDASNTAIADALTGAIYKENENGRHRILPPYKHSDTIKVARDNKIVSAELCRQAEQIFENVKLPYDDSISEQGAEDAIRTAEQILKEVEERP
jgi:hypothetical protein